MKYLRNILIWTILGGAFGAKIGAFLSVYQQAGTGFSWIETGFVFGSALGFLVTGVIAVVSAFAPIWEKANRRDTKKSVMSVVS